MVHLVSQDSIDNGNRESSDLGWLQIISFRSSAVPNLGNTINFASVFNCNVSVFGAALP